MLGDINSLINLPVIVSWLPCKSPLCLQNVAVHNFSTCDAKQTVRYSKIVHALRTNDSRALMDHIRT